MNEGAYSGSQYEYKWLQGPQATVTSTTKGIYMDKKRGPCPWLNLADNLKANESLESQRDAGQAQDKRGGAIPRAGESSLFDHR